MRKFVVCIFLVLVFLYACSGKSETAADWFAKADALNYTDPNKAIEYLNNAIKLQPNFAAAFNIRGISYSKLGQNQRAIEDFNEAIRLKPDDSKVYNNRGITYTFLFQYQLALDDMNKAIKLKPDAVAYYHVRGQIYFKQGNKKLGCQDAKKACELGDCKLLESAKSDKTCR